jgi:hypothetical protein
MRTERYRYATANSAAAAAHDGDRAAQILVHRPLLIEFMSFVRCL